MIDISEIQRDALGEIFNIGVGRAAASLSIIVREEVTLSAPRIAICRPEDAVEQLLGAEFRQFSTVSQNFSGPFSAQALLVFPEHNALEIVRLMAGATSLSAQELSEFEQEAMCEVGNIILNACLSALADMFHADIASTLPVHRYGDTTSILFATGAGDKTHAILLLHVDLTINQRCINGHLVFLLSLSSLQTLLDLVQAYLVEQGLA